MFANEFIQNWVILASVPPTIIALALPCLIKSNPSPIEWVPDAQAVTIDLLGPFAP